MKKPFLKEKQCPKCKRIYVAFFDDEECTFCNHNNRKNETENPDEHIM